MLFAKVAAIFGFCFLSVGGARKLDASHSKTQNSFRVKMEAVNQEHPFFPGAHGALESGLALSGGGLRAMSWSTGVMRGLEGLGLLDRMDAVSSVSGSSWVAAPYIFAQLSATELLGSPTTPDETSMAVLNATRNGRINGCINSSAMGLLTKYVLTEWGRNVWDQFVAEIFMRPFDLHDRSKFMAGSASHVSRICAANPQLSPEQFMTPNPERPQVLIMGGLLVAPPNYKTEYDKVVSMQMSPDYTGSPFWPDYNGTLQRINYTSPSWIRSGIKNVARGGGMLETFAFGSQAPIGQQSGSHLVDVAPPSAPLSLTRAVSISSSATYWPVDHVWPVLPEGVTQQASIEHMLGDGGLQENSGLLALVQRKVKKLVAAIGAAVGPSPDVDFCKERPMSEWETIIDPCDKVSCTLTSLFGFTYVDGQFDYGHNQLFKRSDMPPVLCDLQRLQQAGKPLVLLRSLQVQKNTWWGIEGGFEVKLLVVYLSKSEDFEARLPPDTRDALRSDSRLEGFPFFPTSVYLEHPRHDLLAALGEFSVRQNADLFRDLLA